MLFHCLIAHLFSALNNITLSECMWASQVALVVKNLPSNAGDIRNVGSVSKRGRCLKEGMASKFSILAWRIPWTEEPGELWSTGSQRVRHDWRDLACMHASVYLSLHLLKDILVAFKFWTIMNKTYKHSVVGFCVDIGFQLLWVNTKEHNCYIVQYEDV